MENDKTKPKVTREQALMVARQLGCRGAHEHDGSWMPCSSHEEFLSVGKGSNEMRKVSAKNHRTPRTEVEHRTALMASKSGEMYESRAMAEEVSRKRGCRGVRTIVFGGQKYYAPCVATERFDTLRERGVAGIETLPDGGLVSAKSDECCPDSDVEGKSFVNRVSRSTDPDVFQNPDSARVRARNLGCIGIRRYTASDGKTVWLPCSNGSDYNRVMGLRTDRSPKRNPRTRTGKKSFEGLGEMRGKMVTRPKKRLPNINSETINDLAILVRKHNASVKKQAHKTNLRDVKQVYLRGLAVGSEADAKKRVSTFLKAMSSDEPMPKGSRKDFDLVPDNHPSKNVKLAQKDGDFTDGTRGVKIIDGCCPQEVIRRHRLL
jgi:hypothetical protein